MYKYIQKTGQLYKGSEFLGTGYSGYGEGKNNGEFEKVHDVGPIPRGTWVIMKPSYFDNKLGQVVMKLIPVGFSAYDRTSFRIHGDSIKSPGTASHGCIVISRPIREKIASSQYWELLEVV